MKKLITAALAAALIVVGSVFSLQVFAYNVRVVTGIEATKILDRVKYGIPECRGAKAGISANVYCRGGLSGDTYGDIAGEYGDFVWFKKINKLPQSVTRSTLAPADVLYAFGTRN